MPPVSATLAECLVALDAEAALPEHPFAAPETRYGQRSTNVAVGHRPLR